MLGCSKDKEGCSMLTYLEVAAVISQKHHMESCLHTKWKRKQFKKNTSAKQTADILTTYYQEYILVFASGNNIRLLATSKSWSMVGTFKMMSEWYLQLFTFHTFVADKLVPAL
ncbi:hypothetical protein T4B_5850 [Trichinella pseudospiralis]|uniref:Uncharacterized protein n=1 Tax=Trichinella pseudospiralis TaxID=6337 RepID=A0A0V1GPI8_TRIPS|nr:hypothetical protein T4B_5850 [Trichinella pseudospiralis]